MEFLGPLFVVGMPRSGTKLLRGLLNEHPRIGIPRNETEFLPHWIQRWDRFGDLSDRSVFHGFWSEVRGSVYFVHRLEEQGAQIDADTWYEACRDYTVQAVFEALVRHDAGVPDGGVWGDKSPGYLAHLPLLKAVFPRARFVHIIRDARDGCLSQRRAFGKSTRRAAQRWRDRILAARRAAVDFSEHYLELRYEDLLADPAPELDRVCRFVGLSFQPAMLELSRPTENIGHARGEVRIVRENTALWQDDPDDRRRRRIERIAGDVLRSLDYPVTERGRLVVPAHWMRALQIHDGAQLMRREAQKRGWPAALRFRWRMFAENGSGVEQALAVRLHAAVERIREKARPGAAWMGASQRPGGDAPAPATDRYSPRGGSASGERLPGDRLAIGAAER